MSGEAIAVKMGLEVFKRGAPKGLLWLTTYITGKEILILGQSGSGKTSFVDYLHLGILEQEGPHIKSHEIDKTSTFLIKMGRDGALNLKVRRAVDTPGQIGPVAHANLVGKRRPHVVLVMLDSTNAISKISEWLNEFCERLDYVFRQGTSQKKLKTILIILNKRDKIKKTELTKYKRSIRKILKTNLSPILGAETVSLIPILECISVKTKGGTTLIDSVIRNIAKRLAK